MQNKAGRARLGAGRNGQSGSGEAKLHQPAEGLRSGRLVWLVNSPALNGRRQLLRRRLIIGSLPVAGRPAPGRLPPRFDF
jgi:hypothetical protein